MVKEETITWEEASKKLRGKNIRLPSGKVIKNKGWEEAPDISGKAPEHVKAATRNKVKGVSKSPQVKKEKDWKVVAKKELEKELGVKTKLSNYQYYTDLGAIALESTEGEGSNGEREWIVFKDEDDAREAAKAKVKEDLENEPEVFTQSWLQNFITVYDTDKRIIAGEEADSQIEGMDDEELVKEAGLDEEWNDLEVKKNELFESESEDVEGKLEGLRTKQDDLIEKAKDSLRSSKSDQIQDALEDPVEYFVEQQGIYSREDLMKQSFIRIDIEKAAEDAIDTDGVSHFLDNYDGAELELPSGAIAYGTN
ncbi:MAG: hypothetical protein PHW62_00700 [Candidatus Ratteibacteria bacterium]|nr:hypothetical protein [Candidatus Ratteibacteria bacterium]